MTKLTIVAIVLLTSTSAFAAKVDNDILHDCLYDGYPANYCIEQVHRYHNEDIILRGNEKYYYFREETPTGVTILRGR